MLHQVPWNRETCEDWFGQYKELFGSKEAGDEDGINSKPWLLREDNNGTTETDERFKHMREYRATACMKRFLKLKSEPRVNPNCGATFEALLAGSTVATLEERNAKRRREEAGLA